MPRGRGGKNTTLRMPKVKAPSVPGSAKSMTPTERTSRDAAKAAVSRKKAGLGPRAYYPVKGTSRK